MAEIPKQELLIKLMGLTGSANDNEALSALRKANALLVSAGWDWRRVLEGKITIIADPFAGDALPEFTPGNYQKAPPQPAPQTPKPQRAQPTPSSHWQSTAGRTPPPPPPPKPNKVRFGGKSNLYAGWCYCCGHAVNQQDGYIFKPADYGARPTKSSGWDIVCTSCNALGTKWIPKTAAPRIFPTSSGPAPTLGSL